MATKEIKTPVKDRDSLSRTARTMAMEIVLGWFNGLDQDDRNDIGELIKAMAVARTSEDKESIVAALKEILDQKPVQIRQVQMVEDEVGGGLKKWMNDVSKRIRELRKAAGMTQAELATSAGLPQSHISRLEAAKHSPSRSTLEKIAAALNVNVTKFDA